MSISLENERRLARPGADLAWSEVGHGPVALWAHGVLAERRTFERMGVMDLDPIADASRRLVRYDARGHGRSSGTANPVDFTWPHLAGDLIAVADHVQPDQPVIAIGASMGSATILHAVLQAPERFDRLVLVIPPTAWEMREAQGTFYAQAADRIETDGRPALDAMVARMPTPPILAGLSPWPVEVGLDLLPSVMRGAGRSNLPATERLRALTQPTLILAWKDDPIHPLSTAERLTACMPDARLHVADEHGDVLKWPALIADFIGR